jgi:crotonobetainyl-CoA:carnitine CoA-transferase CaiB-like acyl-CoA transferase
MPANSKRVAARAELEQVIVDVFAALTGAEVVERLEAAQIANARVKHHARSLGASAAEGTRTLARSRFAGRPVARTHCCPPGTWNEGPRMDPIPGLGEHTDAILAELGLAAPDIATLRAVGAV